MPGGWSRWGWRVGCNHSSENSFCDRSIWFISFTRPNGSILRTVILPPMILYTIFRPELTGNPPDSYRYRLPPWLQCRNPWCFWRVRLWWCPSIRWSICWCFRLSRRRQVVWECCLCGCDLRYGVQVVGEPWRVDCRLILSSCVRYANYSYIK